jgi:hypothetical protein
MTMQRYGEMYDEIYGNLKPESYICGTETSFKQAKKLIEQGFQYVYEIESKKLFNKPK